MTTTDLPFELAIETVLNDVSYSNPLPDWYSVEEIDVSECKQRLKKRAASYLKGDQPLAALTIQVPTRSGEMRTWQVPAVNDQIIFQACVAKLTDAIAKQFNAKHVFSGKPDQDSESTALMESQTAAWIAFQNETLKRIKTHRYILELDIQRTFASINRAQFFDFLATLKPPAPALDLIRHLVNSWSGADPGLPLTNDSLFFLGSAYLTRVDGIVARYTKNYIRFVDDYRIFGASQRELEQVFEKISRDLAALGFRLNPRKVKLASQKDYLETITKPEFESPEQPTAVPDPPPYIVDVDTGISSQLVPQQTEKLVVRALERPSDYLHDGIGRYLLGSLRRYRLNAAIRHRFNPEDERSAPGIILRGLLAGNPNVLKLTNRLLSEYSAQPGQAWRLVWLIYLVEQATVAQKMKGHLTKLEADKQMPRVVQLWARRCREGRSGEPPVLREEIHDLSYLDAGLRCYGDKPCTGEGF